MSSRTPFQKFTLFALLVMQVWLVARVQMLQAPAACAPEGGNGVPVTRSDTPFGAAGADDHAAVLARIDARCGFFAFLDAMSIDTPTFSEKYRMDVVKEASFPHWVPRSGRSRMHLLTAQGDFAPQSNVEAFAMSSLSPSPVVAYLDEAES